jgi:hypothetical protein
VGSTPITAVTHEEYENAVSDVLGVSDARVDGLPVDGSLDGVPGNSGSARNADAASGYETVAAEVAMEAAARLGDACADRSCIAPLVRDRGARLSRRPLTDEEVAEYQGLYDLVVVDVGHSAALAAVLSAMLQSPLFLYRVELGAGTVANGARPLGPFELAGRLASFLWRSVPDAELLAAAASGALDHDDGISAQVSRMMADPRFDRALVLFHEGWMGAVRMPAVAGLSPELEADMHEELARFVQSVLRSDRPTLQHLLMESRTPVSSRLAAHYGATPPAAEWETVDLPERAGILGRALPLVANSHATEVRSIYRGLLVHRRMLCRAVGAPPAAAGTRTSSFVRDPSWTDREYITHLTLDDATCAGCHARFGPIGFGFDAFDRLGQRVAGVDESGELDHMAFEGVGDLEGLLSTGEAEDCVARRWFAFAVGRPALDAELAANAAEWRDLRTGVGTMDLAEYIARIPHMHAFRSLAVSSAP